MKLKLKQSAVEVTSSVREVHDAHRSVQHSGATASLGCWKCFSASSVVAPTLGTPSLNDAQKASV